MLLDRRHSASHLLDICGGYAALFDWIWIGRVARRAGLAVARSHWAWPPSWRHFSPTRQHHFLLPAGDLPPDQRRAERLVLAFQPLNPRRGPILERDDFSSNRRPSLFFV